MLIFLGLRDDQLRGVKEGGMVAFWRIFCMMVCPPFIALQLMQEYRQFSIAEKWHDYFWDVWNIVDLSGLFLSLIVTANIITRVAWFSMSALRVMGALASFFLLVKLYDWLRLFQTTAFYMELI